MQILEYDKLKCGLKMCVYGSEKIRERVRDIWQEKEIFFTKKHTKKSYKHQIKLISIHRYRNQFECVH